MRKTRCFIYSLLTTICFAVCFVFIAHFLSRKNGYIKNAAFYQSEDNFDILFFGTSHMVTSVLPMELWREYGMTSYNLGNYGELIPSNYWNLNNALQFTTPSLVVIDVFMIQSAGKYAPSNISQLHDLFDTMPYSQVKIDAINDLLPEEKRNEFFFPFSLYHNRWENLKYESLWKCAEPSPQYGADADMLLVGERMQTSVASYHLNRLIDTNVMELSDSTGKEYLIKMIELCQERNIDVLLVGLPCIVNETTQAWMNSAASIAEQYGIHYYSMIGDNCEFIHYETAFLEDAHLNSSAAKDTTYALGNYIKENYAEIKDHRNDYQLCNRWNSVYMEYLSDKIEILNAQQNIYSYLMLLNDKDFECNIEINSEKCLEDFLLDQLLQDIDNKEIITNTENELISVIVKNKNTGEIISERSF